MSRDLKFIREMPVARDFGLTVRYWVPKFGRAVARRIRLMAPIHSDKCISTALSRRSRPWRAVDRHGAMLDVLVSRRRIAAAAKCLMRELLKRRQVPWTIVTDTLRSYKTAIYV
ncbi:DDE-type integrase/transposase/recombinase [Burkholderia alba]|uniref:DDE-type integrase/transposase/recombinase n=1 Tax=Burkholderia alba TaxID=2683677 RepID=UPI002B05DFED|nr:DDE-type integrase/transposase/recombinase [Burkholderia alba]